MLSGFIAATLYISGKTFSLQYTKEKYSPLYLQNCCQCFASVLILDGWIRIRIQVKKTNKNRKKLRNVMFWGAVCPLLRGESFCGSGFASGSALKPMRIRNPGSRPTFVGSVPTWNNVPVPYLVEGVLLFPAWLLGGGTVNKCCFNFT